MNEQNAAAIDTILSVYNFQLREAWDGPGSYGFDLAGPNLREAFGEVSVDESSNITLGNMSIESTAPADAFLEEVIVGLLEVLVPREPVIRSFLEAHGEGELRAILARHVEHLRDSLVVAIHSEMSRSYGNA